MPLEFTEYRFPKLRGGTLPQVPFGPKLATQVVAIGAGNLQSAAFQASTELVVITKVDADARIEIGANPVAVAGSGNSRYVKTGSEYAFAVEPGQGHKLGVINA